jgi:hypothetical protein
MRIATKISQSAATIGFKNMVLALAISIGLALPHFWIESAKNDYESFVKARLRTR